MDESSTLRKSFCSPYQWLGVLAVFVVLASIIYAPIHLTSRPGSTLMVKARVIALTLFVYAKDHNNQYPTGKSSTEVFQKLIDDNYVTDPTIFWDESLHLPGKIKPTSNTLKPENVCFDVTISIDGKSPDDLPVVFETGYKINYVAGGEAKPINATTKQSEGLVVSYKSNSTMFLKNDGGPDHVVPNVIPASFVSDGKKYQQLTPDGVLTP